MAFSDKELGMDRKISRRDFMNGAAMAIGAAIMPSMNVFAQAATQPSSQTQEAQNRSGYDPPALHGMRGSHDGSFQVAHSLRDGSFWRQAGQPIATGEKY